MKSVRAVLPFLLAAFALTTGTPSTYAWSSAQATVSVFGGASSDQGNSIAVDSSGNLYTTGYFEGTVDFDPGAGTSNLTSAGGSDVFVSKLDSSGNFVWAKSFGGTSSDIGNSIAVDSSGNVYTTGFFEGTVDFDPGAGTSNLTSAGDSDVFVSKLNSSGNFVWAKGLGGTSSDFGFSIAVDSSGNVYTTGSFAGTADFDPGAGTTTLTSAGNVDVFVSKLNSSGNFVWAKGLGGASFDSGNSIAVDSSGNLYTTGYFEGTVDFDSGAGTNNLTSAGGADVFVSKLDSSGNFVWAKSFGGTSSDIGQSIAVDSSGNVYTTGYFQGTADFDPGTGTTTLTSAGNVDVFVSKLNSSGNFVWAKGFGGDAFDYGNSIAVDSSGNLYTTGYFQGTVDFDPGTETSTLTSAGSVDVFVSKLNSSGNFVWAKSFGGTSLDLGTSIAVDSTGGNIYTTGTFGGTVDFDPGAGTSNLTSAGSYDVFVLKLTSSGESLAAPTVVYVAPTPVPYLKTLTNPKLNLKDGKLICTPGTYNAGYTLDGVIQGSGTTLFTPSTFTYNLFINGITQTSLAVTSSNTSASWNIPASAAGALITCSVTVSANGVTNTDKSSDNTSGLSNALSAQSNSIAAAESVYAAVLSANSKAYQKALVDNRAKWRSDIEKIRTDYYAERERIKSLPSTKTTRAQASVALKTYTSAQKKSAADYKASQPAAAVARDAANKAALDAKTAAIAKANAAYGSFIESIGYGVLIP
jgi:hypothetical protein